MEIKKFELYHDPKQNTIFVILSDVIEIPYYHDGCASPYAFDPVSLDDPNEFIDTYKALICHNYSTGKDELIEANHILAGCKKITDSNYRGFSFFLDHGTSCLRNHLGLMTFEIKDKKEKLLYIKHFIDKLIDSYEKK